jgi:hypothetical protein
MGTAREPRESEKILRSVYDLMPNLIICTWYSLFDDALEQIDYIKSQIAKLEDQIRIEKDSKK